MFKIDYNPLLKRLEERRKNLTENQIKLIKQVPAKGENLKVLKRARKENHDGDIFVCTLNGIVYYYGKILKAKVVKNDPSSWENGCILVCLFREKTNVRDLRNYKGDYNNILMEPFIVTSQYWSNGWFETIGNEPLTEKDKNLDYGFYSKDFIGSMGGFYRDTGDPLNHFPKHFSGRGVTTLVGVYLELREKSIIDPSLLLPD